MEYRVVKKNGDKISSLGFGCMRLASKLGKIDEVKAKEQIMLAIGEGVNYFDTAYPYHGGESENFLGRVFSDKTIRDKVKIATKLPPWSVKTRDDMDRILNEQLEKLQVESIDYYLVHGIMGQDVWERLKGLGIIEFLDQAKSDGRIKNTGFSCHSDISTFKNVVDDYDWTMCQIQYNYLDENVQAGKEGLNYATERDIAVFVMEPLRGGSLVGKIPKKVAHVWNKADVKRTPAEWALKWILNHEGITCILSGMNVDDHIKENIQIASNTRANSLKEDEVKLVESVRDIYKALTKIPCTACAYCMPCPVGVNITVCFDKYNDKYMFGSLQARVFYQLQLNGVMSDGNNMASQCVNCGLCEKNCPQHIEIRKELKQVSKEMEGLTGKILGAVAKRVMKSD
jgi:predicted aldo/keto reductase-like oxidoreductase